MPIEPRPKFANIRHLVGLNQAQFAALLGVPPASYHQWERRSDKPAPAIAHNLVFAVAWFRENTPRRFACYLNDHETEPPTGADLWHALDDLAALRQSLELSRSDMACVVGVSPETYANWERAICTAPAALWGFHRLLHFIHEKQPAKVAQFVRLRIGRERPARRAKAAERQRRHRAAKRREFEQLL